jgi:predicted PurR-regulated permease PerM
VSDTSEPDRDDVPDLVIETERTEDDPEFLHDHAPDDGLGEPGRPLNHRSPFMWGLLAASGALLALWVGLLLLQIGSVLVLVVVALFLAVGLNPLVELLMRRGFTRPWAVLCVIVIVLLAFAGFVFTLVPVVAHQVTQIADNLPDLFTQLQRNRTIRDFDAKYDVSDKVTDYVQSGGLAQKAFGGVLGVGLAILGLVANTSWSSC